MSVVSQFSGMSVILFTYKEDKESVIQSFEKLIEDGVYREELYSDL